MTTPDHHLRPCDALPARRRAAPVLPWRGRPSCFVDSHIRHHTSHIPHLRPAFSLIELVIVLSLASILAAIAIPRYGSLIVNYRIDSAANRVISDIAVAQAQARSASTPQPIAFTALTSSYQLTGLVSADATTRQYIIKLTDDPYQTSISSASFGAGSTITFDIYGRPDKGGTVVLRCGTRTKTITVDANTGKATAS